MSCREMSQTVAHPRWYGEARIEPLLKFEEVQAIFRQSRRSIERLVAAGALPAVKVGGSTRFRPEDIRAYIDAHLGGHTA